MTIERITSSYYRVPIAPSGDAGHGLLDHEEMIVVDVAADGMVGQGYAYTIGRGGRAIQALIEHDLAPLLVGQDAADVEGLWRRMWQGLLYVGRGGLAAFAVAALDIALWDLRGLRPRTAALADGRRREARDPGLRLGRRPAEAARRAAARRSKASSGGVSAR